jgi:hypothetical protein
MRTRECRYATFSTDEIGDIIFATYIPKLEIDLTVAKELVSDRMTFVGARPHYVLIDFTNVRSVSKEARDYMNSSDGGLKGILGGAFLSTNVVATLFINLYLKVNRPVVPARFFTDRKDAVQWLQEVRTQVQSI